MPGWINVPVKIETRNKLDNIKNEGQSYDSLLNELIETAQTVKETKETSTK